MHPTLLLLRLLRRLLRRLLAPAQGQRRDVGRLAPAQRRHERRARPQ
jgi:hypothetical protein